MASLRKRRKHQHSNYLDANQWEYNETLVPEESPLLRHSGPEQKEKGRTCRNATLDGLLANARGVVRKIVAAVLDLKICSNSEPLSPVSLAALERVSQMRAIPYTGSNSAHQALLRSVWEALKPETQLSGMISTQWSALGFQGKDPGTDFRGLGIFGLRVMERLCLDRPAEARGLVNGPLPFAITALNLISELERCLKETPALCNQLFIRGAPNDHQVVHAFSELLGQVFFDFENYYRDCEVEMIANGLRPELVRMQFSHICKSYFMDKAHFETNVRQVVYVM